MKVRELMTQGSHATLTPRDTLELAAQMLLWGDIGHLAVVSGGRVVGSLAEVDLVGRGDLSMPVGEAMRTPPIVAAPDDDLATAAATMAAHGLTALPVVNDEQALVGTLLSADLLRLLVARTLRRGAVAAEPVAAAMTRNVVTARPGDLLADAAARMRSIGVRHLPVVDGDECLVGILSDRDLRTAVGSADALEEVGAGTRARVRTMKVRDVMSRDPLTTSPGAALEQAGRALVEHRIGALPVIDDARHVVGMLSYVDYIRATTAPVS
jgi:acetoin utilization protein AcuB